MVIEQAIYGGQDAGGNRLLARSSGFLDAWLPEVARLCAGFGERPPGVACPQAVFALPLTRKYVAVVQVADQPGDPPALAFRLLVLPVRLYADLGGDPFRVSDQYPPNWTARGDLPSLQWTAGPTPRRLVADLSQVLNVEAERTQTLLGGTQILFDGGRLLFERPAPDEKIVRDLWALLPTSARRTLWPASFAFANVHRFHVVVTPKADGPDFATYVKEADAGNYPEGHYELALQRAVEHNDQADVDSLLARRSRAGMVWLAIALLLGFILVSFVLNWGKKDVPDEADRQNEVKVEEPILPKEPAFALEPGERKEIAARLGRMGKQLGLQEPAADSDAKVTEALVALDRKLDEKLGDNKPRRKLDPLDGYGPVRSQLRALLWKYGVKEYDSPTLDAAALLRRWQARLVEDRVLQEDGRE